MKILRIQSGNTSILLRNDIQGLEKGYLIRRLGGRGSDFQENQINPKNEFKIQPTMDWKVLSTTIIGLVQFTIRKTHHHFNIQDFFQKGSGPYEYQQKLPRRRKGQKSVHIWVNQQE